MVLKAVRKIPRLKPLPAVPLRVSTIETFIGEITRYAESTSVLKRYRGQRDASWENIPGLFRSDLEKLEQDEKRAIREIISVHPNEFADDESMFDRLVRMQHFGLPTRLMDVSQNPLVALYFATESGPDGAPTDGVVTGFAIPKKREKYFDSDSVSCIANLANMTAVEKGVISRIGLIKKGLPKKEEIDRVNAENVYLRLHHFIQTEKYHFLPIINPIDLFKPYYVQPKMSNRRILAQAGGFIIHGLLRSKNIAYVHPIIETRFIIPEAAKLQLRKTLDLMGINDSTLYPELDRAAKRISARYVNKS